VNDYFNYFTEIEERFCQRRGRVMLCSTLDWALMETWKDAGIPLEAVLRGIDAAFDRYDARGQKTRKVNSIAYCSQEVLAAAEEIQEAAIGTKPQQTRESGLEPAPVATFLERNAVQLEALLAGQNQNGEAVLPPVAHAAVQDASGTLRDLATGLKGTAATRLEDLERRLTVMEEKLFATLLAATPDGDLVAVRAEADRELAPYRRKMIPAQIDHLFKQYIHKRLLERYGIPRLSLFYM
jgi:hypothetical protein